MNDDRYEQLYTDALADLAPGRAPRRLTEEIKTLTRRTRPRPRWLALITQPPMRASARLTVGSPTARVAAVVAATLLLALMLAGAGLAGASLMEANGAIVVAQDGSGTVQTISQALELAQDGDTILVRPGIYPETLAIDRDITLMGKGPRQDVIIDWSSSRLIATLDPGTDWEWATRAGVMINGSDATLAGLTVRGPAEGVAVVVDGGSPSLEDLAIEMDRTDKPRSRIAFYLSGAATPDITDSAWDAYLASRDGAAPTLERNTISMDTVSLDGPGAVTVRENRFIDGASISLSDGVGGLIEGNQFEGGSIGVDTGSRVEVRGNTLRRGAGEYGEGAIFVRDAGSAAEIVENEVVESGHGIQVASGASATVARNRLSGNEVGIALYGASQIVRENTLDGGRVGIVATGGALELADNVVERMRGRGLAIGHVTDATITGNTSCGNGENLWTSDDASFVIDSSNEICPDEAAD